MQLLDPGPQPPPFEVEYSVLEADMPQSDRLPHEDAPSPEVTQVDIPADVAGKDSAEPSSTPTEQESKPVADSGGATSVPTKPSSDAESAGLKEDAFGAGVSVGDGPAASETDPKPSAESESAKEPGAEARSSDSGNDPNRKKGKRPNRRRRSRRGQKKGDGSPPKTPPES